MKNMSDEDTAPEAATDVEEETIAAEKIINEEYKVWKKNSPFLYDSVMSTALEWPTLTVQWFKDRETHAGKDFSTSRLLLGTHTSGNDQNYVQIASVQLPSTISASSNGDNEHNIRRFDETTGEVGGYEGPQFRVNVTQRIDHDGEVNRARYMPQNQDIIATMSVSGDVLVFDRTQHPMRGTGVCKPQIRLTGHSKEGYGLSWSPHKEGTLLSASEDTTVRLWDITQYNKKDPVISNAAVYDSHTAVVNDVSFHPVHDALFASVSDDLTLQIHDTRRSSFSTPAYSCKAHADAVNAVAFNEASEYVVATASADQTVGLWDLRNLKVKLHSFEGHDGEVTSLQWSPHEEPILASAAHDRRIIIWDLSRIGEEQAPEDAEDGPPELLFMHGGHTNRISDFAWNPTDKWWLCSAAEDNLIQCWKVAQSIVDGDSEDVPDTELEEA